METQEIIQEEIDTYQRSHEFVVGASVNASKPLGVSGVKQGGKADISYNRSNARQKVMSSIGPSKGAIDYLDTSSEVKVDSEMVKLGYELATDPSKLGKGMKDDFITIGLGGRAVVTGLVNVGKTGVVGAVEAIQRGVAATGGVIELVSRENKEGELAQAEGAAELEKAIDKAGSQLQERLGIKDSSKVKLYQGDSEELKGTGHAKNNASFYEGGNEINYNTSGKDFKKVDHIADVLGHESTHKAISETKYAKHMLHGAQEEAVAKIVGKQARMVANACKKEERASSDPSSGSRDHIAWNAKNKDALKGNNERLKSIGSEEVKASPWLLGDGSPYAGKMTTLEEIKQNQQLREDVDKLLEDSGAKERLERIIEDLHECIS